MFAERGLQAYLERIDRGIVLEFLQFLFTKENVLLRTLNAPKTPAAFLKLCAFMTSPQEIERKTPIVKETLDHTSDVARPLCYKWEVMCPS